MPYLEQAGFGSAALIRTFDLRYDLISALVERWRPETHTFHFSCGECTVTLEDVALQLGLPIDGSPVTGVSAFAEPAALSNATEGELICAARVCIMHIIRGVLMPDSNNNKVHIMCLPLLADLTNVCSYSWGSAVLAVLYRELCQTTKPAIVDIGECLTLLYLEAVHCPDIPTDDRTTCPGRSMIPSSTYVHSQMWCTNAPIINFNVVEWYHGDQVLRQFGCVQYIPDPPYDVGVVHGINKRGKPQLNWGVKHQKFVTLWNNRMGQIPQMVMASDWQPSLEYIQWYSSCGKPYLLRGQSTVVPPHIQRLEAYEPAANMEAGPAIDPDPEPEPEPEPKPDLEQSHSHGDSHCYHLDLAGNNYFSSLSGGKYPYEFDIFRSYPPQYSTLSPYS
ncbi:hypothetical protein Gotur_004116 [Gossypium turneri]